MSYRPTALILASIACACLAAPAPGADWGSVKGHFTYKGQDKNQPIVPNKDVEFCSKHKLEVETLEVSDKGDLQNAFVFLYVPTGKKVEINPEYKAEKPDPQILDNKGCRFEPHAMVLWNVHPLEIHNSDTGIGHNTNGQKLVANPKFNEQVSNDNPIIKKFDKPEPIPTEIACNVHPWMNAVVLIKDHPYMAVSDKDGNFEIKNVPAGKQSFAFWHESKGFMRDLKVGSAKADRKGQVTLDIKPGQTLDLGDITVTPAILGK
jgi:hypothetical protein